MGPVTDTHRIKYAENVKFALQEKKDQFGDSFTFIDGLGGKEMRVTDIVGPIDAILDAPEGGDTPDLEGSHEPVWVRPRRILWGKIVRKTDQIMALTDYKSEYVQSGVNGVMRKKNTILSGALFGPRLIGNEVPVSTAWAGDTVPVDFGSTGTPNRMSVPKILNAMRLMEQREIDLEEEQLYLAMDPKENEELYTDITFTSKDYRDKAVFEDKRVKSILGMPILSTQKLADYDANTSTAALYAKSGMHWGPATSMEIKSKENPAKQYREHPQIEWWIAATRSEDYKVVKILNKKA